jgi:hypothetical protein
LIQAELTQDISRVDKLQRDYQDAQKVYSKHEMKEIEKKLTNFIPKERPKMDVNLTKF